VQLAPGQGASLMTASDPLPSAKPSHQGGVPASHNCTAASAAAATVSISLWLATVGGQSGSRSVVH